MAQKIGQEDLRILQAVEKLPFSDEDKNAWREVIQESGANEELIKEILSKSAQLTAAQVNAAEITSAEEGEALTLARNTAELTRTVHSWRLEQNLRNINNRGRQRHR
jgi:hypothetical protein